LYLEILLMIKLLVLIIKLYIVRKVIGQNMTTLNQIVLYILREGYTQKVLVFVLINNIIRLIMKYIFIKNYLKI
jgi:hypothetical protein